MMADGVLKYYATDKEIFDLLMSSKQRINLSTLHEMAKERGIFYSPNEVREDLANYLSLLPYDFEALDKVLVQSTNPNRAERVTSVTLDTKVTNQELKELVTQLQAATGPDEKITSHPENPQRYVVQLEYSEIDFARTTLLQRREREADIRFVTEGDKTTIRMPANEKAKDFVGRLTKALESKRLSRIPSDLIEVSDLTPGERTEFFTKLMTEMKGYGSIGVSNIKVHSGVATEENDEEESEAQEEQDTTDSATAEAAQEMLYVVEDVALNGKMLMLSPEYQDLRKKGFYITSITWISQQQTTPFNQVEFDAGFEYPKHGRGFRYNVRGLYRKRGDGYTKTLRPIDDDVKQELFPIIEQTARKILAELRQEPESDGVKDTAS